MQHPSENCGKKRRGVASKRKCLTRFRRKCQITEKKPMFDRWESQWRRGFLGSSQFLSNWNIINPPKELNVTRVVILIFLRAIIKDDEELWRDRRANAMLRNSFSANSGPWNGRGEVCHQCRWYETQCAIHFILYFRVRPNQSIWKSQKKSQVNIASKAS